MLLPTTHCVFKEDSTTTKLRVVFDGSPKSTTGVSINDAFMVGPVVQDDLFSIIIRFRFYSTALSADIEKMYRQVGLKEEDRDFHRIPWRDSSDLQLKHLRMTRVIYGVACSAHVSTRALSEIAKRTKVTHVKNALESSFYVDDYLGGANSLEAASQLVKDLRDELLAYGFPLRKWCSSHPELIKELPIDYRAEGDDLKLLSEDYKVKALGISWKPNADVFVFKVSLEPLKVITKRNLLSAISKLFDPLGWLVPIVIQFKILMQQTWVRGLKWDELVPPDVSDTWNTYRNDLPSIETLEIPRSIVTNGVADLQIHIFSDASEKAYSAVAYARVVDNLGNVNSLLLTSKTRVAPVKTISLPRLELGGADLASKLAFALSRILETLPYTVSFHAWTDSTIVLHWLSRLPKT